MATPSWMKTMEMAFNTYKSMLITNVVRQFQLMKRDDFLHPLLARWRWVGVDVHTFGHLWISFTCHHPSTVMIKMKPSWHEIQWPRLTCCEICTGNRLRQRYQAIKYIWTYCLNLIREISSAGTFDCKETKQNHINQ